MKFVGAGCQIFHLPTNNGSQFLLLKGKEISFLAKGGDNIFTRPALVVVADGVDKFRYRRSIGSETTLIVNTTTAKRKPTPQPTAMSFQPEGVVKARRASSEIEFGTHPPKYNS